MIEVTTENGTRIILDVAGERGGEGSRWMRIPALGDDGRLNLQSFDGRWRRLLWFYPVDETDHWDLAVIEVGKRLRIHVGMADWWTSTIVTGVRKLEPIEEPRPITETLDDA
ncbi:hypothetical protein [Nocardioides sp. CER19]|uniref:hypothetical protein n=1 Tax=Nocardioides sp. CER19 TaxID=3038538 RepID=UPI00244D451D|nr:hypothetical protein [Nocardioides sp. CER19]MDH2413946.1 hypothetical protein [Nocardioides sp. CER19]